MGFRNAKEGTRRHRASQTRGTLTILDRQLHHDRLRFCCGRCSGEAMKANCRFKDELASAKGSKTRLQAPSMAHCVGPNKVDNKCRLIGQSGHLTIPKYLWPPWRCRKAQLDTRKARVFSVEGKNLGGVRAMAFCCYEDPNLLQVP